MGIISYITGSKNDTASHAFQLLDNGNITFDGIDGKFHFIKNSNFS